MTTAAAVSHDDMVTAILELSASAGVAQVAETLAISEEQLEAMLAGELAWSRRAVAVVEEMIEVMDLSIDDVTNNGAAPSPLVSTDDHLDDWRGTPQAAAADMAAAERGVVTHGESQAAKTKAEMYRYLEVLTLRQFDVNMDQETALSLLAYRLEIELLIILYYRDTVPLPGMNWDAKRRIHESDSRSGRLNLVRDHQRKAERFFCKVRRWMGRSGAREELVRSVAREAAAMDNPLDNARDADEIISRSEFGRLLKRASG